MDSSEETHGKALASCKIESSIVTTGTRGRVVMRGSSQTKARYTTPVRKAAPKFKPMFSGQTVTVLSEAFNAQQ